MLTDALANMVRAASGDGLLLDARRGIGLVANVAQLYETCQRLRNIGFTRCVDISALQIEQPSAVRSPRSAPAETAAPSSEPSVWEAKAEPTPANSDVAPEADSGLRTADLSPIFQFFMLLRLPSQVHAALQLKWKYTQTADSFHPSLSRIWPSAGLAERELWELLGIAYSGNDNLVPLLLDPQFDGFPLRRDFVLPQRESYAEKLLRERHEAGLISAASKVQSPKGESQ